MLWGVGKDKVYAMIQAGEIKGVKMGTSRNSRWRVDLMTVWEYKVRAENGDGIKL